MPIAPQVWVEFHDHLPTTMLSFCRSWAYEDLVHVVTVAVMSYVRLSHYIWKTVFLQSPPPLKIFLHCLPWWPLIPRRRRITYTSHYKRAFSSLLFSSWWPFVDLCANCYLLCFSDVVWEIHQLMCIVISNEESFKFLFVAFKDFLTSCQIFLFSTLQNTHLKQFKLAFISILCH